MTQDQDMPPQATKALITAAVIAVAAISSYFMREHLITLMIPPLTVIALLYMPPKTPRGTVIRILAAMSAMLAFNGSVMFGHGLTIPDSFPFEAMTPTFVALTKTLPTFSTLLINAFVIISWLNRAQLAAPQAGSLEAGNHDEADHKEEPHPET